MRSRPASRWILLMGLALLGALAPVPAAAQMTMGARLGWNLGKISNAGDIEVNRESASVAGVYLNLGGALSVQPELLYSKRAVGLTGGAGGSAEVPFRQNFVEIPLLVVYRPLDLPIQPSFYGGASVSFETSCKTDFDAFPDCDGFLGAETESRLWAGVVGTALHLALGPLVVGVDARYNRGLTDIAPAGDARWSYWTVGLEAGLGLGR